MQLNEVVRLGDHFTDFPGFPQRKWEKTKNLKLFYSTKTFPSYFWLKRVFVRLKSAFLLPRSFFFLSESSKSNDRSRGFLDRCRLS